MASNIEGGASGTHNIHCYANGPDCGGKGELLNESCEFQPHILRLDHR